MLEEHASKASILIVEDDETLRTNLKLILEMKGFDTEQAETGQEGLEKAQGRFFNVVILDIKLPDMDGIDLVKPLKEIHPDMALIVTTGHASLETAVRALNEGAAAYVTKPLDMDDVLARIGQLVEKQKLLVENSRLYLEAQQEIAERKRAERALITTEARLNEAQRIAHIGSFEWDIEKDNTTISDELRRIFGFAENIAPSYQDFLDTVHPDDVDKVRNDVEMALKENIKYDTAYRIIMPNGDLRHIHARGVVKYDDNGIAILLRGTNQDITERKQLETQFQQAQKMEAIGTLAGGIAHNFNNLLQMIMSNISLLLMETDSSHPQHEILSAIKNRVKGGAELTKQLLGFARGGKYQVKPTDLNKILAAVSRMFARTHKKITMRRKYQRNLSTTDVDQGQIEQVLLNLFVNAQQAMPRGGKIIMQSKNVTLDDDFVKPHDLTPGRYVKLSVSDTGTGMDQETRGRIFEPFFTTKEAGQGSGLGLASAYGIIKNHEGIITVDSEVGKGTTFDIYLPATDEEIVEIKEVAKEERKGTGTILVVDDEEGIVDAVRRTLEIALGYDVFTAKSGAEAIKVYSKNENKINLVILDLIMPGMDGGETFDKLRELNPKVKVLLSSGYSLEGEAAEVMERGCDGFIQKPFDPEELSGKIFEVLDQK